MPLIPEHLVKEFSVHAKNLDTGSKDQQIHSLDMIESLIKLARHYVGY